MKLDDEDGSENGLEKGKDTGQPPFSDVADIAMPDSRVDDGSDLCEAGQAFTPAKNSSGRFVKGHPGGPGRGHFAGRRQAASGPASGNRARVDLLSLFHAALQEFGPEKFALTLMRKSPVTFAQFMSSMAKIQAVDPTDAVVNIIMPPGSLPLPSEPPGPEREVQTLRGQVVSLEAELKRLKGEGQATSDASDAGPTPGQQELIERHEQDVKDAFGGVAETWTCPDCQRLVGQTRTYPLTKHRCDFCGHASPSLTELESAASGRSGSGIALAVSLDGEPSGPGWQDLGSYKTLDDAIAATGRVKR